VNFKPILLVAGEPNSVFLEIFFKIYKKNKFKSPLILIASKKVLLLQMKKLNFRQKIRFLNPQKLNSYKLNNKTINLIDVKYNSSKAFEKISSKSKNYIRDCFKTAIKIMNSEYTFKLINGPISKKDFLNKRFPGVTEYLADKFKRKNFAMLIYNKKLSVSTITTHLPIKNVSKNLNKKLIINKVYLINNFFKKFIGINKPRIGVAGLNPHCESTNNFNEDLKILKPAIRYLSTKGIKISGPFAADTIFLRNNRKNFDIILGMYHDQVLTPMKTLFEYDAINITLGLPIIRISPDHGPNESMLGKNKSNPLSLLKAINFLDKIK
jgi:4-hydroxythreonine-4-phosphate dehydrogenase